MVEWILVKVWCIMDKIIVKGARENNLKNVDIEIPKDKEDMLSLWALTQDNF